MHDLIAVAPRNTTTCTNSTVQFDFVATKMTDSATFRMTFDTLDLIRSQRAIATDVAWSLVDFKAEIVNGTDTVAAMYNFSSDPTSSPFYAADGYGLDCSGTAVFAAGGPASSNLNVSLADSSVQPFHVDGDDVEPAPGGTNALLTDC